MMISLKIVSSLRNRLSNILPPPVVGLKIPTIRTSPEVIGLKYIGRTSTVLWITNTAYTKMTQAESNASTVRRRLSWYDGAAKFINEVCATDERSQEEEMSREKLNAVVQFHSCC